MKMDAPLGFEPRFTPSKGDVLPLDDGAKRGEAVHSPLLSHPPALPIGQRAMNPPGLEPGHRTRFVSLAALTLSLAACQTPAVKTETVEVRVPVATHPIAAADVPVLPTPLPKRPADARAALDVALAQVCRFVSYGLKADPLLRLSAGLPPQEAPKYPECGDR
jgi:hypothetical protein